MASYADEIRNYASRYIEEARSQGNETVTIGVGRVVRELRLVNRTPAVCSALGSKQFQKANNVWLEKRDGPPSGMSTTTSFTYRIEPRGYGETNAEDSFLIMRGLGKETYTVLGGGESYLSELRNDEMVA